MGTTDKQRPTNNDRQTMTNKQRPTNNDRQTTTDKQRLINNDRQTTTDKQRQTNNDRQTTTDKQRPTNNDSSNNVPTTNLPPSIPMYDLSKATIRTWTLPVTSGTSASLIIPTTDIKKE